MSRRMEVEKMDGWTGGWELERWRKRRKAEGWEIEGMDG